MSRLILALVVVAVVGSCAPRDTSAPNNLDNACALLAERPHYARAFRQAKRKWGVEPHVLMAMIYQESKFISDNRPPHQYVLGIIPTGRQSSAFGYSQALDGTWAEYVDQQGGRGARRDDMRHAADFMGWYMTLSSSELGLSLHDARNQYLAYHEGRSGFRRQSYTSKSWLMRVAGEVESRAATYQMQLASCPRRL
ncbi:transglycosylase SLT domain-containing protein [Histidinibacterium aquaticum]|uniref:Lytic transglycosylase n=1 Tax=Histidinibacterium aquaticum TaxID=2613962 RepID=A0A5J5GCV1_9RHOB|nr:lytic transglycosylase [Histidinibacterium aquaticum]KAA9006009.1 lytic transglycosylase [Histidinibacterium aquaticum]